MNMILVAGTAPRLPYALGDDGLFILLFLGASGAALILTSALLLRKHAPAACPTYTDESR